jgi:hypothetical protein
VEDIYRFIEEGMPPMQAAVGRRKRSSTGGDGGERCRWSNLRAGQLHERHGRPLHGELQLTMAFATWCVVCELHLTPMMSAG